MKWLRYISAFLTIIFLAPNVLAEPENPDRIIKKHFWGSLYKDGGQTFFCEKKFRKKTSLMKEGYIYSPTWIREHLGCGTPRQCRRNSEEFVKMITDLHNIVPAQSIFEFKIRNSIFGALEDEVPEGECGLKKALHYVEPRKDIRGDIARIMLYMHTTYDLPLVSRITDMQDWNRMDPPSDAERDRNTKIAQIQGSANPFVTNPELADELE